MTISEENFTKAVLNGVRHSMVTYEKWSGGWTVWYSGVESFVASEVARAIYRHGGLQVSMETSPIDISEESGGSRKRGRTEKALRRGGRVDVVVWTAKGEPIAAVEVKRSIRESIVDADTRRILSLLERHDKHRRGHLKFGAIAVPTWFSTFAEARAGLKMRERNLQKTHPKLKISIRYRMTRVQQEINGKRKYCVPVCLFMAKA